MAHLHQTYEALCFHIPSLHLSYWGTGRLAGLHGLITFNFTSKQVKIESGKTPRGEKWSRYEVSEINVRFERNVSIVF